MAAKRSSAARVDIPDVQRAVRTTAAAPATRAAGLDRLVHDRTRLAIVTALSVNPSLSFTELKGITQTTDGNLSVHARKLEEASYIRCEKYFEGRMPKTEYRLTAGGRRALEQYLNRMEELIKKTRQ
jgi:DNA-binding MarR family transcriptional regulator